MPTESNKKIVLGYTTFNFIKLLQKSFLPKCIHFAQIYSPEKDWRSTKLTEKNYNRKQSTSCEGCGKRKNA